MKQKGFIVLSLILTASIIAVIGYILIKNNKSKSDNISTNSTNILTTPTQSDIKAKITPKQESVYNDSIYDSPRNGWKKITVDGCGNGKYIKISFSLPPGIWNVSKSESDNDISYYANNVEPTMDFNFGCSIDKAKFKTEVNECSSQYQYQELTRFDVGGVSANSCYEPTGNRVWPFYLPVDENADSQLYFWSHNIDKATLSKLFASFQFN